MEDEYESMKGMAIDSTYKIDVRQPKQENI